MTPHFYLKFQNVTIRSLFWVKTTEKMLSDFVKSQKKNEKKKKKTYFLYLKKWRESFFLFFFFSLNVGNIRSCKINAMEIKKNVHIMIRESFDVITPFNQRLHSS